MNSTSDIRQLVEFAVGKFLLSASPAYVNLLKLVVDFYDAQESLCAPDWAVRRNPKLSHDHCKRLMPKVITILEEEYGLTVVPVNRKIATYIPHGNSPQLDDTYRTTEFYRRCYTCIGKGNWADGFVSFPRDSSIDHPLLEKRQRERLRSAGHKVAREFNSVQSLHSRGLISAVAAKGCLSELPIIDKPLLQLGDGGKPK